MRPEVTVGSTVGFLLKQKLADHVQLAKLRLSLLVLATALVGFWLGAPADVDPLRMVLFGAGTLLIVGGANALNQIAERREDALMARTAARPLPSRRMGLAEAWAAALTSSALGIVLVASYGNGLAAMLGLAALVLYAGVYTPLKRRSEWSTAVGALAGSVPPLMGWTASRNALDLEALVLFGILFFWQFPHTWAIASMYEDDYRRAGCRALPLIDPDGVRLRRQAVFVSTALVLVSLTPVIAGFGGGLYFLGAALLNAMLLLCCHRYATGRSRIRASQLMAASLVYLPLMLGFMILDRGGF